MKHIETRNWEFDRSERTRSLLMALNRSGQAEAGYFKGRRSFARLLFGRGHPSSVRENDDWNQMRISYQGREAIEIFDSDFEPEGTFFDENFTEVESQRIEEALAFTGFVVKKTVMSKMRWIRLLFISGMLLASINTVYGLLSGDFIFFVLYLTIAICFLMILLRT